MKFQIDVLGIFLKVVVRINKVTFAPLVVSTLFILLTSLLAHCARRLVQKTVKEPFVKLLLEEAIAAAELCGCCFELIVVVSTLFILLTSLLAHCARRLVQKTVKEPFVKLLLEEAIAAAELCGCCFELIVVADNFGVATYAIFLFALTIWWSMNWGDATACPYTHIEDVIEGKGDIRKALLKTWAELTGGLLVFKYVQLYWALEISDTHRNKAFEDCTADLQVPVLYGAIVEGVATCLCRLASRSLSDLNPRYATAIDSFIGTSLVVAAFEYSGGYFNPVLATSLKAGCEGHTLLEHAAVYWLGATAGSILSVYLYKLPSIQKYVRGTTEVNGDSIWADKED